MLTKKELEFFFPYIFHEEIPEEDSRYIFVGIFMKYNCILMVNIQD